MSARAAVASVSSHTSQRLRLIIFVRKLWLHDRPVTMRERNRKRDDFVHADQFAPDPAHKSFRHTVGDTRSAAVFGHSLRVLIRHLDDAEQEIGAAAAKLAHRI